MKLFFTGLFFHFFVLAVQAQQLYLEGFGTFNRTNYSSTNFSGGTNLGTKTDYLGYGGRLAFGADHVQVGGEYRSNLTNPKFNENGQGINGITAFEETYYGGFVRAKISRYPTMRFGLVLRTGVGVYNTTAKLSTGGSQFNQTYDPIIGMNGGFGFSIPILNHTMIELGYTYNFLKRPNGIFIIPEHQASYHSLSVGLSLNFVFGKRAEEYQHLKENWKFQNGRKG